MKNDFVSFYNKYGVDISTTYDEILKLGYDKIQSAIYTIAKIKKIIELCNYLEEKQKNNNDDNDKLKIFLLVSHGEIAARLIINGKATSKELVEEFCGKKFDYLISGDYGSCQTLSPPNTLSAIRNEYVHHGDFTEKIFKKSSQGFPGISSCSSEIKGKVEHISIDFNICYVDFIKKYCECLKDILLKYT